MSAACSNCGKPGHFFRECSEPITSLGILAFRRSVAHGIQWLLVRRRVSIGFIEIMRGKFVVGDVSGIQVLVDQATVDERHQLLTRSFADLWRDLWNGPASRRYHQEYEQARQKFERLRASGVLAAAVKASGTSWTEPEWGFPKGRRSSTESELACALRETYEEAGVRRQDLRVLEGEPLLEEYRGSNGICYRHRYWMAEAPATLEVSMDPTNIDQRREISDVRWCTLEEARALIRDYNREKRAVLEMGARRVAMKFGTLQQRNVGSDSNSNSSSC
jgi:8-oxo-dGTP pyrophosphatase MutT (NUDIX family)